MTPMVPGVKLRGADKRGGFANVNDDNNGLWVVRIEPKPKPVVP